MDNLDSIDEGKLRGAYVDQTSALCALGRPHTCVCRRRKERERSRGASEMPIIGDQDTAATGHPVIGVIKLRIDAADVRELLTDGIEVLAAESRDLQGFLAAQILVSVDNRTIVILTEWSDRHAWSQSRWDVRVGEMTERLYIKSTIIEFEVYTRRADFTPTTISK
jgi:quinol monooxygenase YgiN